MKHLQKLLLFLTLTFFAPTFSTDFSPNNTVIASDLDDVLIQVDWIRLPLIVLHGLSFNFIESKNYVAALWRMAYRWRDKHGNWVLYDEDNNKINGATFQLLFHGMIDEKARSYIADISKTISSSHKYIEGTKKIVEYLKNIKGYTIVYATNKDRLSYDQTAEFFKDEFTSLAQKVVVAQPGNSEAVLGKLKNFGKTENLPDSYKQFLDNALTIQETETIFHSSAKKPDARYYNYLRTVAGREKNIIFIDDRKENIDGFNALNDTTVTLRGIHFKDPEQLVQDLVQLGILSPEYDSALLEEIQYPGILGKIKLFIKKLGKIFGGNWTSPTVFTQ